MFKLDSEVGGRLQEAADSGVTLAACGNTMKGAKLTMADMHPAVSQVPAGIVELMRKQQQGWVYIRP
jgi:intracellular sulfur oxidation DsrE/DsrF family protein